MRALVQAVGALLLWLLLFGMGSAPLQAHLLNMTKVQLNLGADGTVVVDLSLDLTRAAEGGAGYYQFSRSATPLTDAALAPLLGRLAMAIDVQLDGAAIPLQVSEVRLPSALPEAEFLSPVAWPMTEIQLRGSLPANAGGALQLRFDPAFAFEEPIALTLQRPDNGGRMTRWLVAGQLSPLFPLQASAVPVATVSEPAWQTLARYLRFGFLHIIPRGLDHMLFVVGLYLGTRKLRSLLVLVTTFTVAHSLTLILASFGALRVPASVVEPLIALSIAWIGIENLRADRDRASRSRVLMVFAFGLLHGLGFAAALKELGLPPSNFVGALLSFNVGVELGQLAVIALALLLTFRWRQHESYRRWIVLPGSLAITVLALLWAGQRLIA
ncbi:HupE/UreJ family protein [Nevskia ramosa]|uniref:HupE/UreJ family protein n=1 Tax=Nevskia ramosa TaxID=64002 RepID=UPI0003B4E9F1|nr:HupE/UreJ family protein [Nevskia ramosa]